MKYTYRLNVSKNLICVYTQDFTNIRLARQAARKFRDFYHDFICVEKLSPEGIQWSCPLKIKRDCNNKWNEVN